MRRGIRATFGVLMMLLAVGVSAQKPASRPASQPAAAAAAAPVERGESEVLELARAVVAAHGGPDALANTGTIAFDFVMERDGEEKMRRHHVWTPATGAYAVSFPSRSGEKYDVRFDDIESTPTARVAVDGLPLDDAEKAGRIAEAAQAMYINDTYWMFAPLKVLDPGVSLRLDPDEEFDGAPVRVLHLTFADVGMTPGDQYWLLVDPATHMVRGWRFRLESGNEGAFRWSGAETVGGIVAASRREAMDGGMAIVLGGFASGGDELMSPSAE